MTLTKDERHRRLRQEMRACIERLEAARVLAKDQYDDSAQESLTEDAQRMINICQRWVQFQQNT